MFFLTSSKLRQSDGYVQNTHEGSTGRALRIRSYLMDEVTLLENVIEIPNF